MEEIYFNPAHPAGFSSSAKLITALKGKVDKEKVIDWLQQQDVYTLHKSARKRFERRHYNLNNINQVVELDLADYSMHKSHNDGYTFLLCAIDCTSKLAFVEPLKNKQAQTVADGLKSIFERAGDEFQPELIQTDSGKEFLGAPFIKFLESKKIKFRVCRNPDIKASIAERFIRTLKTKLQRYFTYKNTFRYLDVLQDVVYAYNHTQHSSTRMQPAAVTLENAYIAVKNIRKKYRDPPKRPVKYKVGQMVRISRAKGAFEKSYVAQWTEEIFFISKISTTRTPHVYELKDQAGEKIDGIFYEQEINPVNKDLEQQEFIVEKVLKRRGRGKNAEVFVKWSGWPDKFNSWIKASELKDV